MIMKLKEEARTHGGCRASEKINKLIRFFINGKKSKKVSKAIPVTGREGP
jgi:hypothetical protein